MPLSRRFALAIWLLAATTGFAAGQTTPPDSPTPDAPATQSTPPAGVRTPADSGPPPFKLELSKPVEITCFTKSVVVATNAANATTGNLRLSLVLKDTAGPRPAGAWRIAAVDGAHTASLGHRETKTCAESCPLTVAADGNIQLWSPSPKGIDKLADGELLLLGVLKATTRELRATTFKGQQIESLEEGRCETGS
jgi:hypothetical protein